jgi:hypothetical protein
MVNTANLGGCVGTGTGGKGPLDSPSLSLSLVECRMTFAYERREVGEDETTFA